MSLFRRDPPEPPKPDRWYSTTQLQVGDECVCVNDEPHSHTHQQLLVKGQQYVVRDVRLGKGEQGYGGPFIRVAGVTPINDSSWTCVRFEKVVKKTIVDKVKEPIGLDIEKEREGAY